MKEILKELGFSDKEASVYEIIVQFDGLTASSIAHHAGIKRASVYDLLRTLEKQWLISSYTKRGHKYFFADGIEKLASLQSARLKLAQDFVEEVKHKRRQQDIRVEQHRGKQGFSEMYKEILLSWTREFLAWSNFESFDRIIDPDDDKKWTQKRVDNGTRPRLIMVDNEVSREFQKQDLKNARMTKRIPSPNNFSATLLVKDHTTYRLDDDPEVVAIKIQSEGIATMMREIFDTYWNNLEVQD